MNMERLGMRALEGHDALDDRFRAYDSDGHWTDMEREAFGRAMGSQRVRLIQINVGQKWSVRFTRQGPPTTDRQLRELHADLAEMAEMMADSTGETPGRLVDERDLAAVAA